MQSAWVKKMGLHPSQSITHKKRFAVVLEVSRFHPRKEPPLAEEGV